MAVVTNPTSGDLHVNRPLTNFSQLYMQQADRFMSLRAFPNLPVVRQSDLYYTFDKGDFYRSLAEERADGAESAGSGFTLTTGEYFAKVYAFHKDISDRQRANQDDAINLERTAMRYVTLKMLLAREEQMQKALFTNGIWANEITGATSASSTEFIRWKLPDSDPIKDVRTGLTHVQGKTGYRPNKMLIGRKAYDALMDNDSVLDRITGGSTVAQPAQVMHQTLASLFELDAIMVMDAVQNTAIRGSSDDIDFIGGNNALVYYAPNMVGLEEPTAAMQFSWTGYLGATESGSRIKRFRMEHLSSDRIEGEMAFVYKVIAPDMGYFFNGVVE